MEARFASIGRPHGKALPIWSKVCLSACGSLAGCWYKKACGIEAVSFYTPLLVRRIPQTSSTTTLVIIMTSAPAPFSVMVAFEPPSSSREGTDAWEQYFESEVLQKWAHHPCLRRYQWKQEKSGWGQLVHLGTRDEERQGGTTLLREFLQSKGFKKSTNHWGAERWDPASENVPAVRIHIIPFLLPERTLLMRQMWSSEGFKYQMDTREY